MEERTKLLPLRDLQRIRDELRSEGKTVVQCHGCFDIVHPGHIRYLSFAKAQGDVLIVTITADEAIEKGFDRPYIHESLRAENLEALSCVDYICIDPSASALPVLEALQPDIYVKGKEYETNLHPHFLKEKSLVEEYGGKVIYSSGDVVYSSTHIINELRERFDFDQERVGIYCVKNEISRDSQEDGLVDVSGRRLLVLGDAVLDRYVHCDALGVAAEGPILSVAPLSEDWYVGAAALVAGQMAALGAEVTLLTALGSGPGSDRFRRAVGALGVNLIAVELDDRPAYIKTRYLVDDNKVFKISRGWPAPLSSIASDAVIRTLDQELESHEALSVIDFGYGMYTSELIAAITDLGTKHERQYYVDVSHTKKANLLRLEGQRIGTPTEEELRFAFADHESGLSHLAEQYFQMTRASHLTLTMGKKGAVLFSRPKGDETRLPADFLPALSSDALDPVGAGDVFHAGVVLSDVCGASIQSGVYLGSCLAALHVRRVGNRPVSLLDLRDFLDQRAELTS